MHGDEPRQRAYGREPLVAGDAAALPIVFQVVEEFADYGRGQSLDGHAIDGTAPVLAGKRQQEHQGIAVAGLSVPRQIAFCDQMLEEEAPNPWAEERVIFHNRLLSRTGRSAGWPPARVQASFGGTVGSIGDRDGQGKWR